MTHIGGSRVEDPIFFKPWSQALSRAEMLVRQSMLRINYGPKRLIESTY